MEIPKAIKDRAMGDIYVDFRKTIDKVPHGMFIQNIKVQLVT